MTGIISQFGGGWLGVNELCRSEAALFTISLLLFKIPYSVFKPS